MANPPSDSGRAASGAAHAPQQDPGADTVKLGLGVIAVLVVSCFVIPFTLLRGVDAWSGSFLYWSAAAAIVIAISAYISFRWQD